MTYIDPYMEHELDHHKLFPVEAGSMKAFYLAAPKVGDPGKMGSRINSALIIFSPEGIILCGDLCPEAGGNAVASVFGYGLGWFAGLLGGDYLCSKFLSREHVPKRALECVKSILSEKDMSEEQRKVLQEALEEDPDAEGCHFATLDRFANLMSKAGLYDYITDGCGMDYNPRDASILCAIQQRFAAAYAEQFGEVAA